MLPRQTNRIRTALSYAVAAALKAGAHRALIVRVLAARLLRRHTAGGLGRVEPGLRGRPLVTLVLVVRLLIRGLTVLRIDKQIIARRCLGARTLIIRRLYDFITIFCVAPRIVGLVGGVVRESANPHRGVKRRQHRHEDAHGRPHNDEARSVRCVPDAARVKVAPAPALEDKRSAGHRAHIAATAGIVVVVAVALVEMLGTRTAVALIRPRGHRAQRQHYDGRTARPRDNSLHISPYAIAA